MPAECMPCLTGNDGVKPKNVETLICRARRLTQCIERRSSMNGVEEEVVGFHLITCMGWNNAANQTKTIMSDLDQSTVSTIRLRRNHKPLQVLQQNPREKSSRLPNTG